jgi:hypothetical protein
MPKKEKKSSRKAGSLKSQQTAQGSLGDSAEDPQSGPGSEAKGQQTATVEQVTAAFERLRARANQGCREAQAVLIKYMDQDPERWDRLGDVARFAELELVGMITKKEWLTSVAILRKADEMRRQLSRPSQSPLEDLAVERLVCCWLNLQFVESQCARVDGELERSKLWLQRQQQAHRLYVTAEKSWLQLRGLVPSSVQPTATANVGVSTCVSAATEAEPQQKVREPVGDLSVVVVEDLPAKFNGVNRIAHLSDNVNQATDGEAADAALGKRRVNGHSVRQGISRATT